MRHLIQSVCVRCRGWRTWEIFARGVVILAAVRRRTAAAAVQGPGCAAQAAAARWQHGQRRARAEGPPHLKAARGRRRGGVENVPWTPKGDYNKRGMDRTLLNY